MNSSRDVLKRRHSNNNSQDFRRIQKDPKKRVQAYKCTSIFCKVYLFRNTSIYPFVLLWNMDKLKWKTGSDTTIISPNVSFVGSFVISIICSLSYLPHHFFKFIIVTAITDGKTNSIQCYFLHIYDELCKIQKYGIWEHYKNQLKTTTLNLFLKTYYRAIDFVSPSL